MADEMKQVTETAVRLYKSSPQWDRSMPAVTETTTIYDDPRRGPMVLPDGQLDPDQGSF
jgi:hypothetical protein